MADRPPSERLIALFGRLRDLNTPVSDLDEVFWAHARRVEHPLTPYDLETYEACRREGDPIARAVSDPSALLRHLEEAWPGGQLTLSNRTGVLAVQVLIPGLGVGVSGGFRGEVPLSEIGRGVAAAFAQAEEKALSLQQRLCAVYGLEAVTPLYQDWPVEEVSPGRWGAVHHELRLLCATANSPEGAARHAGMNHKGDYGLMLCRERYDATFPAPGTSPDDEPGF